MTLKEIATVLDADLILGEDRLNEEVDSAFASDLMSDVLTLKESPMLLTGLCNIQTIRTCDMANIDIVVFVRNKKPSEDMLSLAAENNMVVLATASSMYKSCGLLFDAGLSPLY